MAVFAQPPCFTADDTVGCVPFTVTLTNCADPARPDAYDFGDGSGVVFDTVHTYTSPGIYTVTQYVGSGVLIDTLIKTDHIRAVNNPQPTFQTSSCEGNNLVVFISDTVYDHYIVDYGDGSPVDTIQSLDSISHSYLDSLTKTVIITGYYDQASCTNSSNEMATLFTTLQKPDVQLLSIGISNTTTGTIVSDFKANNYQGYEIWRNVNGGGFSMIDSFGVVSGDTSYTMGPINSVSDIYCVEVRSTDWCGNTTISDRLCSVPLTSVANNNQNDLSWASYTGDSLQTYQIYRDGSLLATTASLAYSDTSITCSISYCYELRALTTYEDNSMTQLYSASSQHCLTAFSNDTPAAVVNFQSTVSGGNSLLQWYLPIVPVNQYTIERSVDGGSYSFLTNVTSDTFYLDIGSIPSDHEYCYRIGYSDSCGNTSNASLNPITCPISLRVTQNAGTNNLTWNSYVGFTSGVNAYTVEWLDESNTVVASVNVGLSTSYTDNFADTATNPLRYRIRIESNDATPISSYSNIVIVTKRLRIFFPNAFTPNDDGLNDLFIPVFAFASEFKMMIFNRWGELIFVSEDPGTGWNGKTPQGETAQEASYVYMVEIVDAEGTKSTHRGTFMLLH